MIRSSLTSKIVLPAFLICLAAAGISLLVEDRTNSFLVWAYGSFLMLLWIYFAIKKNVLKPLNYVKDQVEELIKNNPSSSLKLKDFDGDESKELSKEIQQVGKLLNKRMQSIVKHKNQREAIFHCMSEGVLAFDDDMNLLLLNPAARELFGIQKEKIKGTPVEEVVHFSEVYSFIEETLSIETTIETEIELMVGALKKIIHIKGTPLMNQEGERIGGLTVFSDITKVRTLEEHRRQFISNVSHELKTPLTSIQGFVETILNDSVAIDKNHEKFLQIAMRNSVRLSNIINDLLNLSRLDNAQEIERQDIRLSRVILPALQTCEHRAQKNDVTIQFVGDPHLMGQVDPQMIEQAVINLVDNAIKYSHKHGKVFVRVFDREGDTVIEVQDYGEGISPDHQPRVFERFYRVDKARSRQLGGTGLGLSIVKNIVVAHGGTIDLSSEPQKGCLFTIRLPRVGPSVETQASIH